MLTAEIMFMSKPLIHHESIQYNTSLTITGTIRGTSSEKLYNELDFEQLQTGL